MERIHEKLNLWQLTECTYVLSGGVNIGIVRTDAGAVVIDSGLDKDYGRRVRQSLEFLACEPIALLTSHAHADHFGGHDYLQRQFPALRTYAPPFEQAIVTHPYLEPVYLFHGAKPPKPLTSKWLMAKPARVDETLQPGDLNIGGTSFTCVSLPGHAHEQIGVLIDGVLFAADAVFGEAALAKYPLPFVQDVPKLRESFVALEAMHEAVAIVVPGHGEPTEEVREMIRVNREVHERVSSTIAATVTGQDTSGLVRDITRALRLDMSDLARYQLNVCAIHAHLSDLEQRGVVRYELADGLLTWHSG